MQMRSLIQWLWRGIRALFDRRFWKLLTLHLRGARHFVTEVGFFVLLIAGVAYIIGEIRTAYIRIEVAAVPEDLSKSGFTTDAATELIRSELETMHSRAKTTLAKAAAWRGDEVPQFAIPETDFGIGELVREIKHMIGRPDTHVTVYIAKKNDLLQFTLRSTRQELKVGSGWIIGGNESDIVRLAAEQISRVTESAIYASYLLSTDRLDECKKVVNEIIQTMPNGSSSRARAHNMSGILMVMKGNYSPALGQFEEALRHEAEAAYAYTNIGNLHTMKKEWIEAIAAYQRAVEIDSTRAYAFYNLGFAFAQVNKPAEAAQAYQNAADRDPENALTFFNLGVARFNEGKLDQSISAYKVALELRPRSVQAWNNLCEVYRKTNRLEEAKEACYRARSLLIGPKGRSRRVAN